MSIQQSDQDPEDSLSTISSIFAQKISTRFNLNIDSNPLVLFLDIDGTISEFHSNPEKSIIKIETLNILKELQHYIQLVLITGRSIQQAQHLIHPFDWNIAGSHGLELRYQSHLSKLIHSDSQQLELLKNHIQKHAAQIPHLRIEIKDYSVALHFREYPHLENQVHTFVLDCLTHFQEFELKAGKFVFELVPKGANKGSAIQQIIQHHLSDHYPIFIGDDLTDEAGFQVINALKGCSIKVGTGSTVAQHRLENVAQVQNFLAALLKTFKAQQQQILEKKSHVEAHCVIKSCEST